MVRQVSCTIFRIPINYKVFTNAFLRHQPYSQEQSSRTPSRLHKIKLTLCFLMGNCDFLSENPRGQWLTQSACTECKYTLISTVMIYFWQAASENMFKSYFTQFFVCFFSSSYLLLFTYSINCDIVLSTRPICKQTVYLLLTFLYALHISTFHHSQ